MSLSPDVSSATLALSFVWRPDDITAGARAEAIDEPSTGDGGVLGRDLTVSAGLGRVRILQIKPAGKRLMSWRDFCNGHRVTAGARFETPPEENVK